MLLGWRCPHTSPGLDCHIIKAIEVAVSDTAGITATPAILKVMGAARVVVMGGKSRMGIVEGRGVFPLNMSECHTRAGINCRN